METNSITDYLQQIEDLVPALQLGLLPDGIGQVYHKFAESAAVTTVASIMSTNPNQDPFNTAGDALYLSSGSATDNQMIYLEGVLYSDGTINGEYLALTGQTAVPLSNVYKTILRAFNANGVELTADAYIGSEATPTNGVPADDNIYAHIPATYSGKTVNQTLLSTFTIPTGFTGFITNWYGTSTKGKDVELIAYARPVGGIFRYQERMFNYESSNQKQLPWLKFPAGTDFKVLAITSQGTVDGSCSYDIVLVSNDFISKFRPLAWR